MPRVGGPGSSTTLLGAADFVVTCKQVGGGMSLSTRISASNCEHSEGLLCIDSNMAILTAAVSPSLC